MANNFRWFDQKSKVIDTPSGQQYIPQQQGALSLIGQSLQGIAAPFAGDYDFGRRQVEMQLRQQQADNEFRAMLEQNRMKQEELSRKVDPLEMMQRLSGKVPPGTTYTSGGLTIPLNPNLTVEEQQAVKYSEMLPQFISGVKESINKIPRNFWNDFSVDKLPYYANKDKNVQELKRNVDQLKASIPFARGGKALTKEEAARIDNLLGVFGRNPETIDANLNAIADEFGIGAKLTGMGSTDVLKGFSPNLEMSTSDKKTLDYNALTGKTTPKDTNSKFKKLFGI